MTTLYTLDESAAISLKRLEAARGIMPIFSADDTLLKVYVFPAPVCAKAEQSADSDCEQHVRRYVMPFFQDSWLTVKLSAVFWLGFNSFSH